MKKASLDDAYEELSEYLKKNLFNFDEPKSMENPFKRKKNHNNCYKVFKYLISVPKISLRLGFISSCNLGEIADFTLYNIDETLSSCVVSVKFLEVQYISQEIFENIYTFNVYLFSDLYLLSSISVEKSFEEINSENINRNYFIYIIAEGFPETSIDLVKIKEFIAFKHGSPETFKPLRKTVIPEDLENTKKFIESKIFTSSYGIFVNYQIFDYIYKPKVQRGLEYIKLIYKYYDKQIPISDIFERFNITEERANEISVDELLYEHDVPNSGSVNSFRKLDQKYNIIINRDSPIMLGYYLYHINNHDYVNSAKLVFESNKNSVIKKYPNLISPNVHMISIDHLLIYPFSLKDYKGFNMIPSLFIHIERAVLLNEFKILHNLEISSKYLVQALATPGYDINQNYEVLEVVGDSSLKYIISAYLSDEFPNESEDFLTKKRKKLIKNKYLSIKAVENFFPLYLKSSKRSVNDWKPPNFVEKSLNSHQSNITAKNLADSMEGVIGSSFVSKYSLYDSLILLKRFGFPLGINLWGSIYMGKSSEFVFPSGYYMNIEWNIKSDLTFEEIFKSSLLFKEREKRKRRKSSVKPKKLIGKKADSENIMTNGIITEKVINSETSKTDDKMVEELIILPEAEKMLIETEISNEEMKNTEHLMNVELRKDISSNKRNKKQNIRKDFLSKKNIKSCGIAFNKILNIYNSDSKSPDYKKRSVLIHKALSVFERKVLNYTFKNKFLLLQALTVEKQETDPLFSTDYQNLEYLGDALLEILVIGNAYKILEERGVSLSPEVFQKLKVSLLSNTFMARIAVLMDFHKFIIYPNTDTKYEVKNYLKKFKYKFPYHSFVLYDSTTPKILSDIWESVSAALLLDGGWKAVQNVYGKILAPYIKYCCYNFERIEINFVSKLIEVCEEKFGKLVDLRNGQKNDKINIKVYIADKFLCEASGRNIKIARKKAAYLACKKLKIT